MIYCVNSASCPIPLPPPPPPAAQPLFLNSALFLSFVYVDGFSFGSFSLWNNITFTNTAQFKFSILLSVGLRIVKRFLLF